jgi:hypothetical protein
MSRSHLRMFLKIESQPLPKDFNLKCISHKCFQLINSKKKVIMNENELKNHACRHCPIMAFLYYTFNAQAEIRCK